MSANILGFPRIGANRELKKALESFWAGELGEAELQNTAAELRQKHWAAQKGLDFVCVNDFSFYDNMLDLAFALGAVPAQYSALGGLAGYFAAARGNKDLRALEMTKWFNTNYHYVVPEISPSSPFKADASAIIAQYNEAKAAGFAPKIQLIGLFTFFALCKVTDGDRVELFGRVKSAYFDLIDELVSKLGSGVVIEFSEPIFVRGFNAELFGLECAKGGPAIECVYNNMAKKGVRAIVSTFFERSNELTEHLLKTDIYGIGLDFIHGSGNLESLDAIAASNKVLFAGVIDGRNVWVANLNEKLNLLEQIAAKVPKERVCVTSSCSLLHVPFSKDSEAKMDPEILSWLSFAKEKIAEILLLADVFKNGVNAANKAAWEANAELIANRKSSPKINNAAVQARMKEPLKAERELPFSERIKIQKAAFNFPTLPTTTIGSFPQTPELRALRRDFKAGKISEAAYNEGIEAYIKDCVSFQEEIGIDVLVHGEPERNDMVEYFGERLSGFVFSQNAWVQSYGSRCVKPPLIFGDVTRLQPMTLKWAKFAQSLSQKIVKGMLTGPVTILNWSFVRDDVSRDFVCKQIALAIRDEIDDLQNGGIRVIQVDEAAFKEGYPLRAENIGAYERFALDAFRISTSVARNETQIHTHMCYSVFNDIIKTIEAMDADVISIETARSGNKLLQVFKTQGYQNEVGPGVYDIHSPRIPSVDEIKAQIAALLEVLPKEQLWINPDCGLKTRKYEEVKPSLKNMVEAVKSFR